MKNENAISRAEKILIEAMEKYCEELGDIPTAFWAQGVLNHLSTLNQFLGNYIFNSFFNRPTPISC